jgi:hypothetical protein
MVSAAIDVIRDYCLDLFKGIGKNREISAEIVIEDRKAKQYKRLTYKGDPEGLRELTAAVKALGRKK